MRVYGNALSTYLRRNIMTFKAKPLRSVLFVPGNKEGLDAKRPLNTAPTP